MPWVALAITLHWFASLPLPIPVDTPMILKVAALDQLKANATTALKRIAPEQATELLDSLAVAWAERTQGRDLRSIRTDQPIYAAFANLDGFLTGQPHVVWLLPCQDYARLQQEVLTIDERRDWLRGHGQPDQCGDLYFFDLTSLGYIGITNSELAADWFKRRNVPKMFRRPGLFATADGALYLNLARVEAEYGETLRGYMSLALFLLRNGSAGFLPGFDRAQLQSVERFTLGLQQILKEATEATFALHATNDELILSGAVDWNAGGALAQATASAEPIDLLPYLQQLPAGGTSYYAASAPAAVTQTLRQLNPEFSAPADDRRALATLQDYEDKTCRLTEVSVASMNRDRCLVQLRPNIADTDAYGLATIRAVRALGREGRYRNILVERVEASEEILDTREGFFWRQAFIRLDLDAAVAGIRDPNLQEATLASIRNLVEPQTHLLLGISKQQFIRIDAPTRQQARELRDELMLPIQPEPSFAKRAVPPSTHLYAVDASATWEVVGSYLETVYGALPAVPGIVIPDYRPVKNPPRVFLVGSVQLRPFHAGLRLQLPWQAMKLAREVFILPE